MGKLDGEGEINHQDVVITGKFTGNDAMDMPVQVHYKSTGYSQTIHSPAAINFEPVPAS